MVGPPRATLRIGRGKNQPPSVSFATDFTVLRHFEFRDGKLAQQLSWICARMHPRRSCGRIRTFFKTLDFTVNLSLRSRQRRNVTRNDGTPRRIVSIDRVLANDGLPVRNWLELMVCGCPSSSSWKKELSASDPIVEPHRCPRGFSTHSLLTLERSRLVPCA